MRLGIDIDYVLADFVTPYAKLFEHETNGKVKFPLGDPTFPSVWYFEREALAKAGYNATDAKALESKVWNTIRTTPFWGSLMPLPGAVDAIQRLDTLSVKGEADIYFITSRPGKAAKFWTELWLVRHGMNMPTVLLADEKGHIAKGLRLDAFIDDRPENISDVLIASPQTKCFLKDAPYNRLQDFMNPGTTHTPQGPIATNTWRVATINDALDMVFAKEEAKVA